MTQNVNIAVKTESGQVKKISHGVIFQPETQFKGGTIKWFDDSKLIKPEYRKQNSRLSDYKQDFRLKAFPST